MRVIRQYANPIYGIEHSTKKNIKRGREDWIGINIPAIISRELFDRVQKRLDENRKQYRNPREPQLLSNLVRCGECGSSGYALRRWVRSKRKNGPACVLHERAYKCNWGFQGRLHTEASGIKRCHNPQIKADLLETKVLEMVKEVMLEPARLRQSMPYFRDDRQAAEVRLQKELKAVDARLSALHEQKRRVIDIYASGDLSRDGYIEKNRELDAMIETLRAKGKELADNAALLREDEAITTGVEQFCEAARVRFEKCKDPASTRQFFLDYLDKVAHVRDKVSLHGRVPIKHKNGDETETNELAFCIEAEITPEDRYRQRMRTAEAIPALTLAYAIRPYEYRRGAPGAPARIYVKCTAAQLALHALLVGIVENHRLGLRGSGYSIRCTLFHGREEFGARAFNRDFFPLRGSRLVMPVALVRSSLLRFVSPLSGSRLVMPVSLVR
jgi:hypothetical protein